MLEEPATHEMMIMGQEEIMAWLEAHPGWHPTREICAGIAKPRAYVLSALRRLILHGEVVVRGKGSPVPEYHAVDDGWWDR